MLGTSAGAGAISIQSTLSKLAILCIVIIGLIQQVNTIWIELSKNQEPCIENVITI